MAINIKQELERLYSNAKTRESSLSERLNAMDQYSGQVNPAVRKEMLDFSDRPAGYNPLQDVQSAMEFSERSRDIRSRGVQELEATQNTSLDLLSQLDALAQRNVSASTAENPEDKFLSTLKLEAAKEAIKKGALKFNPKTGQLEGASADEPKKATKGVVSLVDQILKRKTKPITGVLQLEGMIPGTEAQRTVNLFNQLKGILALENRELLKGTGQISDYESKTLERAASALGRNLSDSDFRAELQKLKNDLAGGTKPQPKKDNKQQSKPKKATSGYTIVEVK